MKRKVLPLIEVMKGDREVGSFYVQAVRTVVGSDERAQVRLHSSSVEPEHMAIEVVGGRYLEAVNLAGDSRLLHDGQPFDRVRLVDGSAVELGKVTFRVRYVPKLEAPGTAAQSIDEAPDGSDASQPQTRTTTAWVEAAIRDKKEKETLPAEPGAGATAKLAPASAPDAGSAPAASSRPASRRAPPTVETAPGLRTQDAIPVEYRKQKRRRRLAVLLLLLLGIGASVGYMLKKRAADREDALEYLSKNRDDGASGEQASAEGEGWGGLADLARERRESGEGPRTPSSGGGGAVASTGGGGFSVSGAGSGGTAPELSPEERLMDDLADASLDIMDEEIAEQETAWADIAAVEAILRSQVAPQAHMCFQDLLEKEPGLSGTMHLVLTLGTNGKISSVSVDRSMSSLANDDLKRCIERRIRSRTYPAAKRGSVTFTYPFRFSP